MPQTAPRLMLLLGSCLLLLNACNSRPPETPPAATASPAAPAATPTGAAIAAGTPGIIVATGDPNQIVSPPIASEFAIPSPTPRALPTSVPVANLLSKEDAGQPLTLGESVEGELASDTSGEMSDGSYFDAYEFEATPGQAVTLTLTSESFDPLLMLVNADDEIVAYHDDIDAKSDPSSRLALAIPSAGRYRVLVTSYEQAEGRYRLASEQADRRERETALGVGSWQAGWLIPGDATTAGGLLMDRWTVTVGAVPVVVWARSAEFDLRVDAYDAAGTPLTKNGDLDRIGRNFDARVVLAPSDSLPVGSVVTVEVSLQGAFAVGGAYQIGVEPLPTSYETRATVMVRPVIVKGEGGERGSEVTEEQVRAAVTRADEIWDGCGIDIAIENDEVQTIAIPGLEFTANVQPVRDIEWTPEENALMAHPSHAMPETGVLTAYFVRRINQRQYGFAYPTTRYPSWRSGMLLVADIGVVDVPFLGTLAHEIGHLLGLNHPDLDDGDTGNDTLVNVMFTSEGTDRDLEIVNGGLTPLQCAVARAAPHLVRAEGDKPLVPPAFQRSDAILLPDSTLAGALTTRDAVTEEEEEQFLDVYYLYGHEGEKITIDLEATAFDPFLLVDGPDGERLQMDDDGGEGWNARVSLTIPETGDYAVGVTSFLRAVGAYQLSVSPAR